MPEACLNYIGGHWKESVSGETFSRLNPANILETVGIFQKSVPEDVEHAMAAAAGALPAWKNTPAPVRGRLLLKAAGILESRIAAITNHLCREEGKDYKEARGETARSVDILQFYSGETWRMNGETFPSLDAKRFLFTLRVPLGVVAAITPWNLPVAIPIWKIAPAVAYGNTVVFKPANHTSLCGALVTQVFEEAGFPPGVVNMVTGSGGLLGESLIKNPAVRGVTFTGSCEIGREIAIRGAQRGIKVQLEMGGKNAVIVLPDADIDKAARIVAEGAMGAAGQKCTATSLALIHREVLDHFTEALVEKVRGMSVGDPLDQNTDIGPMVSQAQLENALKYVKIGLDEGAELIVGGRRLTGEPYDRGYYMAPTVFTNLKPGMRLAQEEIFGPVVGIIPVDSLEQAIEVANGTRYGLSAAICTHDARSILDCVREIEAGLIHINNSTAGAEPHVPFGGFKESTSGYREMGRAAIEFFTQYKTIYFDGV